MKCQHCFKLVFLGVASICVVGLVGCGTPHFVHRHHEPQLLPRPADSAAQVACRVVLDRFEPFIVAKVVHSVPKSPALGFDLFGSIVDAGFDAARENIFVASSDN